MHRFLANGRTLALRHCEVMAESSLSAGMHLEHSGRHGLCAVALPVGDETPPEVRFFYQEGFAIGHVLVVHVRRGGEIPTRPSV